MFEVPDGLALEEAAPLGCAAFTAYGALVHAGALQPGERVAVVAVGGVGVNLVQLARVLGAAQVIAVDVSEEKLALARRMGATDTVDGSREDVRERVLELTDGEGVELAFEALGRPGTIRQALEVVGLGRTGGGDRRERARRADADRVEPARAPAAAARRVLRRAQPCGHAQAAGARGGGPISLGDTISREVGLDEAAETFDALDRGEVVGRAVVRM